MKDFVLKHPIAVMFCVGEICAAVIKVVDIIVNKDKPKSARDININFGGSKKKEEKETIDVEPSEVKEG